MEINPERVLPPRNGVRFELGGFELAGYQPHLVRAFNVLRQYDVAEVASVWSAVCSRLAPGGLFIEGTCDELGRRAAYANAAGWAPHGPRVRWREAHQELVARGWPLAPFRRRLRDNTLTVAWPAVAPVD